MAGCCSSSKTLKIKPKVVKSSFWLFLFYIAIAKPKRMTRIFLLTSVLLLPEFLFGQERRHSPVRQFIKADEQLAEKYNQCLHQDIYNFNQRKAFFPFNKAAKIELISFEYPLVIKELMKGDNGQLIHKYQPDDTFHIFTPISPGNYLLNRRKIKETKVLTEAEIDKLTDILYNIGFTPVKNLPFTRGGDISCYEPRNAILFFGSDGRLSQYIELCFTCHKYYLSSAKIKYTQNCEQKFDLIKQFFLANGVKYGTVSSTRDEN
ncbi:hypothetical protein A0256_10865 [Mucilaginibacter sp. PAMC 26640]|nr:hypothetical protein A0256_10865 [Mucilaginibacter sp. PAMC 26640]